MFLQLAYKNLDLYTLSKKMVIACYEITQCLPEEEKNNLVHQIRAEGLSAYLNIVRGLFRKSKKKRIKFLKAALRSLSEIDACLDLLLQMKYIRKEQMDEIENTMLPCYELLNKLLKS
jgi:four helix bundle protein